MRRASMLRVGFLLTVLVNGLPGGGPAVAAHVTGNGVTYTSADDFAEADLINLVVRPDGTVDLDDRTHPFGFIWVAVSSKGTVVKIDTATGVIVGEYLSSPSGMSRDPSRTTVDKNGNVWVSNRAEAGAVAGRGPMGSIIHIGLEENGQCVDRNRNGRIDTSRAQNDIKSWPNTAGLDSFGGVRTAQDECIIHYTRVNSTGTRHVSVNADNDVWVSGSGERDFDLVDGATGSIVRTEVSVGCGGYGGLIDANGVIWSTTSGSLLRWDTSKPLTAGNYTCVSRSEYGLGLDLDGNVWSTQLCCSVHKYAPSGVLLGTFPQGGYAQGVVADANGDIWIAGSLYDSRVTHLRNDGTMVGNIGVGSGPTGVSVDANGKVWSTNYNARTVSRIDPALAGGVGAVDLTTVDLGGQPYNYSDMTGSVLIGAPSHGTMVLTHDSGVAGNAWDLLSWNTPSSALAPEGGSLAMEAASSQDGVEFSPFISATSGAALQVPAGRYLRLRATFDRGSDGVSPRLTDIVIGRRTTALTARTAVARIDGPEDHEVFFPDLQARLTDADLGTPLAGQAIAFFATDAIDGARAQICTATTGSDGLATCSGSLEVGIAAVRGEGYDAVYSGDGARYFGSSAHAGLVTGVATIP